jgi:hypothetical protein
MGNVVSLTHVVSDNRKGQYPGTKGLMHPRDRAHPQILLSDLAYKDLRKYFSY